MTTLNINGQKEFYPDGFIAKLENEDHFFVSYSSNGMKQYFIITADKYEDNNYDAVRFAVDRTGDRKATVQKIGVEEMIYRNRMFTNLLLPKAYQTRK